MPDDHQELEYLEALIMQLEARTFTFQFIVQMGSHNFDQLWQHTAPCVSLLDITHRDKVPPSVFAYILEVIRFRCQRPGNEAVLCIGYKYLHIVQYCMHNRL